MSVSIEGIGLPFFTTFQRRTDLELELVTHTDTIPLRMDGMDIDSSSTQMRELTSCSAAL